MALSIALLLYDRFTMLDAVGPAEVLTLLPDVELKLVAKTAGVVWPDNRAMPFVAPYGLSDVPEADILLVPGGTGTGDHLADAELLDWIRQLHAGSRYTLSVCTGALLFGAAGLLKGAEATTHWAARGQLEAFGATAVTGRWAQAGRIFTAAGVSAGIDLALHIAALIAGDETAQAIQLAIEYDPQPPFDSGSLEKAPAGLAEKLFAGAVALGSRDDRPRPPLPSMP
jgi:transcriptional regulator GlxA family with amidase domain